MDVFGIPLRVIITAGATADCTQAGKLIEGLNAEHLLADRGYDINEIIALATKQGMKVQIPPKRNRKQQREYDKALYKARHLVETAFLHLKRWRGIATRKVTHLLECVEDLLLHVCNTPSHHQFIGTSMYLTCSHPMPSTGRISARMIHDGKVTAQLFQTPNAPWKLGI